MLLFVCVNVFRRRSFYCSSSINNQVTEEERKKPINKLRVSIFQTHFMTKLNASLINLCVSSGDKTLPFCLFGFLFLQIHGCQTYGGRLIVSRNSTAIRFRKIYIKLEISPPVLSSFRLRTVILSFSTYSQHFLPTLSRPRTHPYSSTQIATNEKYYFGHCLFTNTASNKADISDGEKSQKSIYKHITMARWDSKIIHPDKSIMSSINHFD